jgi:hypothetical protein
MKAFELPRRPFTAVLSISRVTFQTKPELNGRSVTKLFAYILRLLIRDWQKALRTIMMLISTPYFGCIDNFCCMKLQSFFVTSFMGWLWWCNVEYLHVVFSF